MNNVFLYFPLLFHSKVRYVHCPVDNNNNVKKQDSPYHGNGKARRGRSN